MIKYVNGNFALHTKRDRKTSIALEEHGATCYCFHVQEKLQLSPTFRLKIMSNFYAGGFKRFCCTKQTQANT